MGGIHKNSIFSNRFGKCHGDYSNLGMVVDNSNHYHGSYISNYCNYCNSIVVHPRII